MMSTENVSRSTSLTVSETPSRATEPLGATARAKAAGSAQRKRVESPSRRIETIRSVNGTDKTETEIRYFLTSCGDDPAVLAQAIRRHWSIENALHWVLDVTFREDDSRVRNRTAARNLALLRKIALNLIAGDRSSQTSLRGRRKKAAWNDDYMLRIIARQAHA